MRYLFLDKVNSCFTNSKPFGKFTYVVVYSFTYPLGYLIFTYFLAALLYAFFITMPSAAVFIGVPFGVA